VGEKSWGVLPTRELFLIFIRQVDALSLDAEAFGFFLSIFETNTTQQQGEVLPQESERYPGLFFFVSFFSSLFLFEM
jgi:hypothetical protein